MSVAVCRGFVSRQPLQLWTSSDSHMLNMALEIRLFATEQGNPCCCCRPLTLFAIWRQHFLSHENFDNKYRQKTSFSVGSGTFPTDSL